MTTISKAIGWWRGLRWPFATKHDLQLLENKIMSKITDAAAAIEANFARIRDGITALDAKIQALKDAGADLSPQDQAALAQVISDSAALAQAAQLPPDAPAPTGDAPTVGN